ncbi:unnamed protein product (macronuclear) [Paramecium tetraurelia]|uniref:Cyclic nucleotide-binding domain-containing protein n=1 Tax=Paramecium tetraurelia TaxID=5888 RepID=A0CSV1_PARTE|nr:uncharacterized protein GSPATT00010140001 [Paramecium tetraurelia]CAK73868.1 unnamed protein product [Paramecium tetraurelia]|eukprot:XP_001441265.1 hypothetical protein (macronuclear) [Paramecium tetraurelia strain d4-2]
MDNFLDNNSDRNSVNDIRRFGGGTSRYKKKHRGHSRVFDDDYLQKEKRVFKQSLQKLYEESFIKNIIDNSYIKKIGTLSTYQVQVLDDLQFGTDKQIDDIDNVFYSFFSSYLDKISVIYPQSNFKILWNSIQVSTFFLIFLWLPYKLAFETNYISQFYDDEKTMQIEIAFFVISAFDIIICLNEAYIHKGIIINQRYHIIMNYLKTTALPDMISIFALLYELILVHYYENQFIALQITLCLIYGLIKTIKMKQIFNQIQEYFNIKGALKDCLQMTQIVCGLLYFIHLTACLWHGLGQPTYKQTWLDVNQLRGANDSARYAESLHWAAVYLTNVGSTDIMIANSDEKYFAAAISFLSLFVVGIIIVALGFFFHKSQRNKIYSESMNLMNSFMSMNNIDFNLQVRIRNYLDYICKAEQSMIDENVSSIINKLSERLQAELKYQLRASILESCDFIKKNFSLKFQQALVPFMQEINTIPEERVVEMNNIDDCSIYIINKGEMEVVFEAKNKMNVKFKRNNIKVLEKGEYFGFYSFITNQPRTATVVSKGFGKLFKITRDNFVNLLDQFPDEREIFYMIKDKVIINQDLSDLQIKCYGCKGNTHMVNYCPFLHFNPNQDRVIKQSLYPHQQERDDPYQYTSIYMLFRPRKSKFINALLQQQIIEQIAKEYQMQQYQDETQEGTQATHVLIQDDVSDSDSRSYSQMRTRSVSRVNTHSILSMQQQSSNYKIGQSHMAQQMVIQQGNHLPQVDEDEVEVEIIEDQEQEKNQEADNNFDNQMNNRKEFNRKNDPKNTIETAGFGNKFNKPSNADQNIENSEESEEDEEEYEEESSSQHQQQIGKSVSKGSQSPQNSGTNPNPKNQQQMAQKVTFNASSTQQQTAGSAANIRPRTSIKRGTTKTNNTAIVFDNVLAALQENQYLTIEFVNDLKFKQPIITFPSVGDFDKIMTFRKYFPQHNISTVLKLIEKYQKQVEHFPIQSLYSFLYTAIFRGKELRKKAELAKQQQKQVLYYPKPTNKPQKRQLTKRQV